MSAHFVIYNLVEVNPLIMIFNFRKNSAWSFLYPRRTGYIFAGLLTLFYFLEVNPQLTRVFQVELEHAELSIFCSTFPRNTKNYKILLQT